MLDGKKKKKNGEKGYLHREHASKKKCVGVLVNPSSLMINPPPFHYEVGVYYGGGNDRFPAARDETVITKTGQEGKGEGRAKLCLPPNRSRFR